MDHYIQTPQIQKDYRFNSVKQASTSVVFLEFRLSNSSGNNQIMTCFPKLDRLYTVVSQRNMFLNRRHMMETIQSNCNEYKRDRHSTVIP